MSDSLSRDRDDIPVQDTTAEAYRTRSLMLVDKADTGRLVTTMTSSVVRRGDEVQERLLQLTDENLFLKKHARKFEEKAKQLEAKLSRILSEKRCGQGRKDELEASESRHRILELEYQVGIMRDRLQVAKQQLVSYTKFFPSHANSAKFNKSKHTIGKLSASSSSAGVHVPGHGQGPRIENQPLNFPSSELSEQFEMLLMEARAENQGLENQLAHLRDQVRALQSELGTTKQLLHMKQIAHEDEVHLLRAQVEDADETKKKLSDNIQLIRLQRDSRRTSSWLSTLETQCKTLEVNLATSQDTAQQLEGQLNSAQEELRELHQTNLNLNKQVEDNLAEMSRVKELEAQITSLKEENTIMKDANESLQSKAVSAAEKARRIENEEASLKAQISQMEVTLKKEIKSKTDLYSDVSREKNKCTNLTETLNDLKKKFSAMEVELKKLERLTPASLSVVTFLEPGRRSSSATANPSESVICKESQSHHNSIYHQSADKVPSISDTCVVLSVGEDSRPPTAICNYCSTLEKDLVETRSSMGKLHDDLNKTKNLLKGQMATNRECHKEIDILSLKLERAEKFHHEKLEEFMKVMEERAAQMLCLEKKFEQIKSQEAVAPKAKDPKIVDKTPPAPHPIPSPRQLSSPLPEKDVNANDQVDESEEAKEAPSVEIFIDRFLPVDKEQDLVTQKNIFATWELNEQETKYTPIVTDGIFNSGSTHVIHDTNNLQPQIEVLIHQAIGPSDCQTLGKGYILPDKSSCPIQSLTAPSEQLGELKYKFTVRGFSNPLQIEFKSADYCSKEIDQEPPPGKTQDHSFSPPTPASPPKENVNEPQPEPDAPLQVQPVPKPKPKPRTAPSPTPVAATSVAVTDSESSTPSTYTISPTISPQRSKKSKKSKHAKGKTLDSVSDPVTPEPKTVTRKLTREPTITTETEPETEELPMPVQIPVKPRAGASPKKTILRRESSSPEVKGQRKVKKVTVTEIVEERRIGTPTSEDEESYYRGQQRAAEIASAAAAAVAKQRKLKAKPEDFHEEVEMESDGSDSGDGKSRKRKDTEERGPFQIPTIRVQSFDMDSSENSNSEAKAAATTTGGESSVSADFDVISPAEILTVKATSNHRKSKKHKLSIEPRTAAEIDHSSGSGSGDEGQIPGQGHLVKRTKPKVVKVTPSSTSTETDSSTLTTASKVTRRSRKPKRVGNAVASEEGNSFEISNLSEESSSQDSETFKQTIRIEIAHVVFHSPSRVWTDSKIKKIFVEYRFLDFNPEELETPSSVAKPQPGKKAEFNFIKIFLINTRERRKLLQAMLIEKKRIRFTVVSEPPENDSLDCEDIGYAYVPVAPLQKEDLVQEHIPIYDAENPGLEMGSVCISIQARDVLRTL